MASTVNHSHSDIQQIDVVSRYDKQYSDSWRCVPHETFQHGGVYFWNGKKKKTMTLSALKASQRVSVKIIWVFKIGYCLQF